MSGLDLDKLKSQWALETSKLDNSLTLDIEAVRTALSKKTYTAFRRHSYWLMAGLLSSFSAFAALMMFMVKHLSDSIYLLLASPLAVFALAECVVHFLQWKTLQKLDLSSPILETREVLDRLRNRRVQLTKWVLLTSVLLWWPLILVLVKGFTGIDLLPKFPASFIWINVLIGFSFIPTAYLIARYFSNRFRKSPGFQKFLEDMAGKSWSNARRQLDARQRFEDDIALQGDAKALQDFEKKNLLSPSTNILLGSLKRHVLFSILGYAFLIMLIGIFNAGHGGQWHFIVPGILLNLFFVAQMVSGITYRISLSRLDLGLPGDELGTYLDHLLELRLALARISLALLPLISVALTQVMAKIFFGLNVLGHIPSMVATVIAIILFGLATGLYKNANPAAVSAMANISSIGTFKRSKILIAEIKQAASE
ncbi:MAG: hypothetical protein ABI644_15350 [Arenimonas sp.]